MDCQGQIFSGLAGMGDLIVTATSKHSRNNCCGYLIGQEYELARAIRLVGMTVKGVKVLPAAMKLVEKYGFDMSSPKAVDAIISDKAAASDAVKMLMDQENRHSF